MAEALHTLSVVPKSILKILMNFGSSSQERLYELLSCQNLYGDMCHPADLQIKLNFALAKLHSEFSLIYPHTKSGKWQLNSNVRWKNVFSENELHLTADYSLVELDRLKFQTLGVGREYVYGFYLPIYRHEAAIKGKPKFPIKVGRTNNIQRRIASLSTTGTGMLVPALVISTNDSSQLESRMHLALTARGSRIELHGRREWFMTNVREINSVYESIKLKQISYV